MRSDRPLLTLAIPTYNRDQYLMQLLSGLCQQLVNHPEVELLISDNASSDNTHFVVAGFQSRLPGLRYLRNEVDIGADANFLQCFQEAEGTYVWLIGDDDIVVPGSLDKLIPLLKASDYALVYVRPYPFRDGTIAARESERFGRFAQRVPNGRTFIRIVGPMITFISSLIVNKSQFETLQTAPLDHQVGTNLIQLGWSLPLLACGGESLIIWDKMLEARVGNSGGYGICRVFGMNLNRLLKATVPHREDLKKALINSMLCNWFPATIIQIRYSIAGGVEEEDYGTLLMALYRQNWRYWVCVYPVIELPRFAAWVWWACIDAFNRGSRLLQVAHSFLRLRSTFMPPQAHLDPHAHNTN